ncbi:MAG: VacJ family lipoprotein [Magnetococcales bacterium]|nr:VacJ family lipoprotein [Magnetococcales bacterium]MBF0418975.1 VacJ family lipoprotein [Magnetococcales bacterium]
MMLQAILILFLSFFPLSGTMAAETPAAVATSGMVESAGAAASVAASSSTSQTDSVLLAAEEASRQEEVSDPLEPFNRAVFVFNDLVYSVIIKPVAIVYSAVTPEVFRTAVRSFFHNLAMPTHFVNAILQNKFDDAGRELYRFAINTTVGVLGFYDAADHVFKLKPGNRDTGQTLGVYGIGDQVFLTLPFLGPSNLRDSIGLIGDAALDPVSYVPHDLWARFGVEVYRFENEASLKMEEYDSLKKAALDPYMAVREAYLQTRRKQIKE